MQTQEAQDGHAEAKSRAEREEGAQVAGLTEALDAEALARLLGPAVAQEVDAPAPFLDVFNICTLKERNGKGYDVSDFSKLLVEPVAVPSLDHTGVHASIERLEADPTMGGRARGRGVPGPLFYANGRKKKNFRAEVRKAFRSIEEGGGSLSPLARGARSDSDDARRVEALCDRHLHRERNAIYCQVPKLASNASESALQTSEQQQQQQLDVVAYVDAKHKPRSDGGSVVPHAAPREADRKVRRLLSSIRRENQRMDALSLIK